MRKQYEAARTIRMRLMYHHMNLALQVGHLVSFRSAGLLQKTGHERRFRYRFINPLMEPFVTMKGLASGLITEDVLNGSL